MYKSGRVSKFVGAFAKLSRIRDPVALDVLRRGEMADHGEVEYATATGNDYAAHEETYHNFIRLVKVSVIVIVAILVLMAYFLT
jgi:Bacterial aa3 type cytochrome c oxidase subunit IV